MPKLLPISEAARELGVSEQTLRAWEKKGHITAIRLPTGYRRYTLEEIDRVKRGMGLLPKENLDTEAGYERLVEYYGREQARKL